MTPTLRFWLTITLAVILDAYFVWVWRRFRRFSQNNLSIDETDPVPKIKVLLMSMFPKRIYQISTKLNEPPKNKKKLFTQMWQKIGGLLFSGLLLFVSLFLMKTERLAFGAVVMIVAVSLFLYLSRTLERQPTSGDDLSAIKEKILPLVLGTGSLLFALITIKNISSNSNDGILKLRSDTISWILSILLLIACVLRFDHWKLPSKTDIATWFTTNSREILLLMGIVVIGLAIRVYALYDHPYPWSGDEASIGTEAYRILDGQITTLFATGWSGQPYLSFVPTALAQIIWGKSVIAIRMASAIIGTLSIIGLYLLGREIYDRQIATIAAAFLAVFPYHIHFSRIGVSNIMDCLFATLMLWLLFRAVRRGKYWDYLWVGLATGMSIYSYVGSRLVIALAVASFIYIAIQTKGYLRTYWQHLSIFLLGMSYILAPISYYFIKNPGNFMTRIGQENILLSGWLMDTSQKTGHNIFLVFVEQASKTLSVFVAKEAHGNFFNSPEPYLTILGSFFFLIGMGYLIQSFFKPRSFIMMMWFWSVVILGGVLTPSPPANMRMIMSSPAIALILALGIWRISEVFRHLKVRERWIKGATFMIIGVMAVQSIFFYFVNYRQGYYFKDANSELAMEAGLELQQLGTEYDFYLLGIPRVFTDFPTINFLAPENEKIDLKDDFMKQIDLKSEQGAFFVAIPDNQADLEFIAEQFPGGDWQVVSRKTADEVLYYAYTISPSQ